MNAIAKWGLALLLLTAGPTLADAGRFTSLPGNPGLHSASAIVLDSGGNIIYGKDVDTVRPVASITKLMTAIVVLDAGLDLDEQITIEEADKDRLRMTGSRLRVGASLTRRELLLLALMSSENRAAAALGRSYPGGTANFVAQMNAKAAALDMRKMLHAAHDYQFITASTTTTEREVRPFSRSGALTFINTNRLLKNKDWQIELSKTGYINEAGRCLVMQANIDGEAVSIVLLNSFGKLTPFGDSNRLRKWMLANS